MNHRYKDETHPFIRRHELLERISHSSHGAVFRALDHETGNLVVVKMYRALHNWQWRRNLLPYAKRELEALTHFGKMENRHDNTIRLLDFDLVPYNDSETFLWIILQNMDRDLSMRVQELSEQRKLIPLEEIRQTAFHVLNGITHLHSNGFVHRDISSRNVLLGADDQTVKLADFNLTLPTSAQGIGTEEFGDLYYRPPEVMFQNGPYRAAGDMWGLGVLICEMALGRKLFEGSNEMEVLHSMLGILGSPDIRTVPQKLMHIVLPFRDFRCSPLVEELPILVHRIGAEGMQLVEQLLSFEWQHRPTAQEVLQSPFFDTLRTQ